MDEFERRVRAEIARLEGPDFPTGRLARRQREATVRALAQATLEGRSWTGDNGALGPARDRLVVSENNFYAKKHWYGHPLTREVIDNVTAILGERDAREREAARRVKIAWLEAKEMAAAEKQFEKAHILLDLSHVSKKSKQVVDGKEETIILSPANAAYFNTAVNMVLKASDLARRSLGLPVEVRRNEVSGFEGDAIQFKHDVSEGMNDEQLQRNVTALAHGVLVTFGAAAAGGNALAGAAAEPAGDDPTGEG